ncbi:centrosomal protein of 41 kDa-like [Solea solea]|uniref:centrosomal protein of 41 kDa-like n=1 Tax=Solea solea TaxID=90069 RepID=UPI00272B50A1|nr:centrosomal protein of 41 kDa-like [Solea solea]
MTLHSDKEKRIQKNSKYQHVKTKLDTGSSLSKYMERLEERRTYFKNRNDEMFKRLKETTFGQMILQAHSSGSNLFSQQDVGDTLEIGKIGHSAMSTQLSVLSCAGEMSLENEDLANRPCPNCPYLLLDVRDQDDYDRCHIIGAHNFPIIMLSRFRGIKEIWEYKNIPGKIIILYDEDETIASRAATIMCQKGFENVFMLSGGLEVIAKKFPEGMTTGSMLISHLSSSTSSSVSSATSSKKNSLQQRQQLPSQAEEKKWWFTPHDLYKIQQQLGEISSQSGANSAGSQQSSGLQSSRSVKLSSRTSTIHSQSGPGPSRTQSQQTSKISSNSPSDLPNLTSTTLSQSGPPGVESQQSLKLQSKRPLKMSSHVSNTLSQSAAPSAESQQTSKIQLRVPWK